MASLFDYNWARSMGKLMLWIFGVRYAMHPTMMMMVGSAPCPQDWFRHETRNGENHGLSTDEAIMNVQSRTPPTCLRES